MHTLSTHGIEHRILRTHTDRDLRITCTTSLLKNHSVRDWLDLLGNLARRRDPASYKKYMKYKKNKRSDLIIFIRNNFMIYYILDSY